MRNPQGLIIDIDGTVLRGSQAIPGAKESIAELRRQGCPVIFVTNALESPDEQANRLASAGVAVTADEIITALQVLKTYLVKHTPDTIIYLISNPLLLEWLAPATGAI